MVFRDEESEDDLFDAVSAMADRMQLAGDKRRIYIDDHMLQGGYERAQTRESYARIQQEEEGGGDGGNRWGFGRRDGGRGGSRNRGNSGSGNRDDGDQF